MDTNDATTSMGMVRLGLVIGYLKAPGMPEPLRRADAEFITQMSRELGPLELKLLYNTILAHAHRLTAYRTELVPLQLDLLDQLQREAIAFREYVPFVPALSAVVAALDHREPGWDRRSKQETDGWEDDLLPDLQEDR